MREAAVQSSTKPAVRLMAVNEAGFQMGIAPQPDATTRFFKLDLHARDAGDLFDVDAMSQIERHESMAQLDIDNEYSLEDCIKVRCAFSVQFAELLAVHNLQTAQISCKFQQSTLTECFFATPSVAGHG
jgi:hypothetical protein